MAEKSELRKFMDVLLEDVDTADDRLKSQDSQVNRRMLVRTFFALVEGSTFTFRQMAIRGLQLNLWCATVNASNAKKGDKDQGVWEEKYAEIKDCYLELAALDDVVLKPDKTGNLSEQRNSRAMIPVVALSLRAYARHQRLGYDCSHRFEESGWKDFKAAVAIRNRLTHPKRIEHLEVSDAEVKTVRQAMRWFANTVLDMAQAHKRGLRPATKKELEDARRERKGKQTNS